MAEVCAITRLKRDKSGNGADFWGFRQIPEGQKLLAEKLGEIVKAIQ